MLPPRRRYTLQEAADDDDDDGESSVVFAQAGRPSFELLKAEAKDII